MHINIIGAPITYGSGKTGVDKGPAELRNNNFIGIGRSKGLKIYDNGDLIIPQIIAGDKYKTNPKLKYLDVIRDFNEDLAEKVYLSLNSGNFPIVIGGDHSLGIGSVAGVSKYHNNLEDFAIIWIDAHADINTEDTSPSGNIHGMPLAAAIGYGHKDLTSVYFDDIKVKPENVYVFGGRDIDEGEYKIINETGVHLYEMKDIRKNGFNISIDEIINDIKDKGVNNVHVSFDIDSIDPSFTPSTGTPVKGGFTVEEGQEILVRLINEGFVKSLDFVELNPTIDIRDITVDNCIKIIDKVYDALREVYGDKLK